MRTAFLLLALTSFAQTVPDQLIVPGIRVGAITRQTTESDLKRHFGAGRILHQEVAVKDAATALGLVVYRNTRYTPSNRMLTIFCDDAGHPGTIEIHDSGIRTVSGIGLGTTLRELERLNQKPFLVYGFGWDFQGEIVSWEGGRLEKELTQALGLALFPATDGVGNWKVKLTKLEYNSVQGPEKIPSTNVVLRKLDLRVTGVQNLLQ